MNLILLPHSLVSDKSPSLFIIISFIRDIHKKDQSTSKVLRIQLELQQAPNFRIKL